jgi:hypothetical protein
MFDDFIIPDNYNALLSDELNSLDSSCSKTTSSSSSNDPFINYRDDSNDICHSPHLLSPGLSKVKRVNSTRCRRARSLTFSFAHRTAHKVQESSSRKVKIGFSLVRFPSDCVTWRNFRDTFCPLLEVNMFFSARSSSSPFPSKLLCSRKKNTRDVRENRYRQFFRVILRTFAGSKIFLLFVSPEMRENTKEKVFR